MDQHLFLFIALALSALSVYSDSSTSLERSKRSAPHWSYKPPYGPETWGGTCKSGKKQSPINIVSKIAEEKKFTPLKFGDNYRVLLRFEAINNGHTLLVTTSNSTRLPTFQGGGLEGKYIFQQLHFHWPSEHLIDGTRASLEMHLVHYNSKYKDLGIASLHKDGIAVLSVLCNEDDKADNELEQLLRNILDYMDDQSNMDILSKKEIKANKDKFNLVYKLIDLLPSNRSQWYRYDGSLTTPGCDESVMWTIFVERMTVSSHTLGLLRTLKDADGNALDYNYRPVLPLNDRIVYLHLLNSDNEIGDSNDGKSLTSFSFLYYFVPALVFAFNCQIY